jgi:YidC/Oxa1 family membrane protein insertase
MDKQSTLAFVLIGIILVAWLYFNSPEPVKQPVRNKATTEQVQDTTKTGKSAARKVVENKVENNKPAKDGKSNTSVKENNTTSPFLVKKDKEKIITIDTDLYRIELSTYGGNIHKYFLKKYLTWYNTKLPKDAPWYKRYVQLINYTKGNELNVSFVTKNGQYINTANSEFTPSEKNTYFKLADKDSLTLVMTINVGEGKSLQKIFTFYGNNYRTKFDLKFNNLSDLISGFNYDLVWSNGINFVEKDAYQEATYSNASIYAGEELTTVDASSVGEEVSKNVNGKVDWVGIRNKYFAFILGQNNASSDGGADIKGKQVKTKWGLREYYTVALKVPVKNLNNQTDSFELYAGPLDYDILSDYRHNWDAYVDFGSFFGLRFIIRPISAYFLLPLFTFLHKFIPNYGIVIIIFSIIIKLLLWPFTHQSYKSMKRMQLLQPEIAEIKEKFKGDNQRIQKETMNLYSKFGVNPAGGCLPTLLQMPILFALFAFFRMAVELRQQPFMLWITNLSAPDVLYHLPFKIPFFGVDQISGLAILLGITMFFQQKMTMKDPSQKAMVYSMPVLFTLMFMGFSAGLNLYYFMFNLLSIGQQYYINHTGIQKLEPVKNPKKKAGFMQRMMEAAEQQQKGQKPGQKSRKKK